MSDMISRDAVAKAVATLSQEFLDGGSPTAVKVLNLAMDRVNAIPAADARAEALKEAAAVCEYIIKNIEILKADGETCETPRVHKIARNLVALARQDILALIMEKQQ